MSVKIYANSNDLNILHFPELNKYKFKVSTKGDAFFDTPLIVTTTDETDRLREQLAIAVGAINETIEENLGLADGDNCTLIKLKKALAQIREMGDV